MAGLALRIRHCSNTHCSVANHSLAALCVVELCMHMRIMGTVSFASVNARRTMQSRAAGSGVAVMMQSRTLQSCCALHRIATSCVATSRIAASHVPQSHNAASHIAVNIAAASHVAVARVAASRVATHSPPRCALPHCALPRCRVTLLGRAHCTVACCSMPHAASHRIVSRGAVSACGALQSRVLH